MGTQAHQLINQDSGIAELYTDPRITASARKVMGRIDLDPASTPKANEMVKARRIFTKEDDGLSKKWTGRVWLNHPFSRGESACKPGCTKKTCAKRGYHIDEPIPGNKVWIAKLVGEFRAGHIKQALCITYASTSEAWFKPLLYFPQCFLTPRMNYYLPNGLPMEGVTKGSVVTYLGPNVDKFAEEFVQYGVIKPAGY